MFRFVPSAFLLAVTLVAGGCDKGAPETPSPFISEAMAAPAHSPDYGWKTNADPSGGDGTVAEFH